ncbi:hypothetical protein [Flagellimonas meishanensis]|uniref:hypothetical protein n=1 Tax=Flagellimonas meishanensis TaxID=2873264 RepID=UPI001CA6C6C3|nr:hypothetical protein [[Muricauda] meishanensis]
MVKFLKAVPIFCLAMSCGDGDLQIETIDFDSASVQFCDAPQAEGTNLLFKLNASESLILELQSGVLNKGIVGEVITTESTVPGQSKLTYRIFDANVSTNYFCDELPPVSPLVLDEIEAQDGLVIIETRANEGSTNFVHTISLSGVTFVTESGERITNLSINEFGEVTTAVPD